MFFVGREKESRKIIRLLQQERSVILTGKFGIGRTALLHHIAVITEGKWRFFFIDFSQTPSCVVKQLTAMLRPGKESNTAHHDFRYKSGRSVVVRKISKEKRKTILVLDNIAKLTNQRLQLIRYFRLENRFQFVAIVERFLPEADLFLLRAVLVSDEVIVLQNLNPKSTKDFLRHIAEKHAFNWSEQHVDMLVSLNRGYPLGLYQIFQQELHAKSKDGLKN